MNDHTMNELTAAEKRFLYQEAADKRFSDREAIDEHLSKATSMLEMFSAFSIQHSLDVRPHAVQNYMWVLTDLLHAAKKLNLACK